MNANFFFVFVFLVHFDLWLNLLNFFFFFFFGHFFGENSIDQLSNLQLLYSQSHCLTISQQEEQKKFSCPLINDDGDYFINLSCFFFVSKLITKHLPYWATNHQIMIWQYLWLKYTQIDISIRQISIHLVVWPRSLPFYLSLFSL